MSEGHTERLEAALDGKYRIERKLGEGGMASVYLAEDVKHKRNVALKILRPELAAVIGSERFLAEIQTTANLQHPHILPLFDSGEAGGYLYYVMPYIDGETLREKLDRERQLGVEEAVRIARDVADALDYAHRHGVIHRDIKPGNILLHDGRPVVADFGIALAVSAAGGGRMTETGLSLGTPHYMSPEQASADRDLSPKSDVYSLGCVLYEMLAGQPPHTGPSAQSILVHILTKDVTPLAELRHTVPPHVAATVAKAIEKLPADRFETAKDFKVALGDEGFSYWAKTTPAEAPRTDFALPAAEGPWNRVSATLATLLVGASLVASWALLRPDAAPQVLRFSMATAGGQLQNEWIALAPDGSSAVLLYGDESGARRLWLWRWTDGSRTVVQGVEEGPPWDPVFSADGSEIAYFQEQVLYAIPVSGGSPRVLAPDANCCARWEADGFVYYRSRVEGNIRRVSAAGGPPEDVTSRGEDDEFHYYFHLTPGGDVGLFTVGTSPPRIDAIRLATGERKMVTEGRRSYSTPTGDLVFAREDGRIYAAGFDTEALALSTAPVPVVDAVGVDANEAYYSLSQNGTLLYWQAESIDVQEHELVWVSRAGAVEPVDPSLRFNARTAGNMGLSLSPDGRRVAFRDVGEDPGGEIWIKDLDGGSLSRLTFSPGRDWGPSWSADGIDIVFASARPDSAGLDIWTRRADGTGEPRLLQETERSVAQVDWSPDGEWLVFRTFAPPSWDIFGQRPGVDEDPVPLLANPEYNEWSPTLSPDGRWLAYVSNESGTSQVFVRPFPDVDAGRWQVSTGTGFDISPLWSNSGRELFFGAADSLYTARVEAEPTFRVVSVESLFEYPDDAVGDQGNEWYAPDVDDQRFLMVRNASARQGELFLVQNFFAELRERLGEN